MSASISHVQYLGLAEWLVYPFFASIFSKVQSTPTCPEVTIMLKQRRVENIFK